MKPIRHLAILAVLTTLAAPVCLAQSNKEGNSQSTCPRCSAPDGTSTGGPSDTSCQSFEWSINLGLARYPKPASYSGIGDSAYDRDGTLPSFRDLVGRYFPSGPLQQSQIPMRINQPMITGDTFHPSCLMLDSEAIFERITKNDGGSDYIHQVVTDDAFTQIDILAEGAHPPGITDANNGSVTVGAGWQIRVWKKPADFQKPSGSTYYTPPSGTPLTNAVFCRPNITDPGDNTLLYILKESTGIEAQGFAPKTTVITQTTTTSGGILRPDVVTTRIYPSVVTNPASAGTPVSEEIVDYVSYGARKWDYTLNRTEKIASITNGTLGSLFISSTSTEAYEDFSANSAEGGEPGMKRLMSMSANGLTTTYDYYREPATAFAHGRPKSVIRPDGSWTAWEYFFGTVPVFTEYSSWLNVPMSDMGQARKKVTTVNGGDFTVETYVAGQLVAKSKSELSGQTLTESEWDGAAWHGTVTTYNADNTGTIGAGRIASVVRPDGTRTTYDYQGSADAQVVTEVSDSTDSPAFARKTTTTYNNGNIAVVRESFVVAGGVESEIDAESWLPDTPDSPNDPVFDALGRPIRIRYGDNTTETNEYACCGLQKHIARDGTITEYDRDGLKRVWRTSVTAPAAPTAVTTVTTTDIAYGTLPYDTLPYYPSLAGITTTRYLEGATRVFLGASAATLDGMNTFTEEPSRMSAFADDRLVTWNSTSGTYRYAYHKRRAATSWTTDSNGYTFLDGQPCYQYNYATQTTRYYYPGTHFLAGGGLCTTVYEAGRYSYEYRDMLGRTVRTTTPESGSTNYTYYAADAAHTSARGKVLTVTDADSVTATYDYPSANSRTVTRTVLATTGTTTAPVSLMTETTDSIDTPAAINGISLGVSFKSETKAGQPAVDEQPAVMALVSTSYRALNGHRSATVSPGGSATVTESPLPNVSTGVSTTTTTRSDLTRTKVTTTPTTTGSTVRTERLTSGSEPTTVEWTESAYDLRGRPVSSKDSRTGENGKTTYPATNLTESGTPLRIIQGGRQTDYEYDYEGRLIKVDAPDTGATLNVTHTSYWPSGLVKARWGDQTNPVWYQYNGFGQMTVQYTWKSDPGLTQATPAAPNVTGNNRVPTTWSYGSSTGRLDYKRDAADKDLRYYYTSAGRLRYRVSARSITTYYYYDTGGNLRAVDYPTTSSTPDILYTRDTLGRQASAVQGTLTVTGGTLAVSNSGISLAAAVRSASYGYNAALQLSTETTDLGGGFSKTLTRHYDASGRPRSLAVGTDYTTAYGYDASTGRLTQIWDHPTLDGQGNPSGTAAFTYGYVSGSGLVHTVSGPVHTVTNTYDPTRDSLATKSNTVTADTPSTPSSFAYTVNAIGQRETVDPVTGEGVPAPTYAPKWTWGYDNLGQLVSANDRAATADRAYQYDAIGNRKKTADSLTLPQSDNYETNPLNQYTKANGVTLPATPIPAPYDPDGNLRFDGGVNKDSEPREYVWDAENRLIAVKRTSDSATLVTYAYDHLSRLVSRSVGVPPTSTTHYLYDGWNRIAEYAGQELGKTYLWGMDLSGSIQGAGGVGGLLAHSEHGFTEDEQPVATRTTYYPTYDGNGNITEYLDATGEVAAHFEYDPFGNTTVASLLQTENLTLETFQYRFSTKPRDPDTGLYYYGYRWYDPLTGRWPSRDPIGEHGGVNLYGFVGNSSIYNFDRLGLDWVFHSGLWRDLHPPDGDTHNPFTTWSITRRFERSRLVGEPYKEYNYAGMSSSENRAPGGKFYRKSTNSNCPNCCDEVTWVVVTKIVLLPYTLQQTEIKYTIDYTVEQRWGRCTFANAQRLASVIDLCSGGSLDKVTDTVDAVLLGWELADEFDHGDVVTEEKIVSIEFRDLKIKADADVVRLGPTLEEEIQECLPCPSYIK